MKLMRRAKLRGVSAALMTALSAVLLLGMAGRGMADQPLPGAIFTTNADGSAVNANVYTSKDDVYLNGGPRHEGAAGLPDGDYYVKVTEPNGTLLGTSVNSPNATPVTVENGEFAQLYQLSAILIKVSNGSPGYDDTTNPGGEYKVWVSDEASFPNNSSKTDNFKVKTEVAPPVTLKLSGAKFYDANTDGVWNKNSESGIPGWKIDVTINGVKTTVVTDASGAWSLEEIVDEGTEISYEVCEQNPVETDWMQTAPALDPSSGDRCYRGTVTVGENGNDISTLDFGNVCLGAGGGHTLGFWSNKNGQAILKGTDNFASALAFLRGLNLRTANGSNFDPTSYTQFRNWLLNATATNMAYMLSAQLAAMALNAHPAVGFVNGSALIYAPGATSANPNGFATVSQVITEANTELGLHGSVLSDSEFRPYQEALKNALDAGNNNLNFVQATPCAFSFASDVVVSDELIVE